MEQKNKPLMIFLGGELRNERQILTKIKERAFDFYAVDAGYYAAKRFGIAPGKILGDFDSAPAPADETVMLYPVEKDQTDSELAYRIGIEEGYTEIWLIAPFGGRLDHTIANLSLLDAAQAENVQLYLYDGENLAFLLPQGNHTFSEKYRYISFFPWKETALVTLTDFKYPLKDYLLKTDTPIGISNEPLGACPTINIKKGTILCICIENMQEEL